MLLSGRDSKGDAGSCGGLTNGAAGGAAAGVLPKLARKLAPAFAAWGATEAPLFSLAFLKNAAIAFLAGDVGGRLNTIAHQAHLCKERP